MKFRTEVEVKPFGVRIGYDSSLLAIGSCFADYMAGAMQKAKFRITANPAGVLFNPASIAETIRIFGSERHATVADIYESGGRFFDFRFHGSLAGNSTEAALCKINKAIAVGHTALVGCDTVIITFGTAWVYILNKNGQVVANCHKQPSNLFTRRRLSVGEIVAIFSELLDAELKSKHVIFTVSPVRHLGDGADENFLSKATLKLAVAELVGKYDNADYFPAYEIMNDDLRDYRFYADDLVHPSMQAVEYIREKFFDAVLAEEAKALLPRIEKIVAAAAHRPFDPQSEAYRAHCRRMLEETAALHDIADFTAEENYFAAHAE